MAWALQFDGVDDYAQASVSLPSGNWESTLNFTYHSANGGSCLYFTSPTHFIRIVIFSSQVYLQTGVGGDVDNITLVGGTDYEFTLGWNGTQLYLNIDGVPSCSVTPNDGGAYLSTVDTLDIGGLSSGAKVEMDFKSYSIGSAYNWDATASDHSNTGSQPVLVDTVGSNNATGVNMPTDGSAWKAIFPDAYTLLVEYDLPTITGTHTYFVALLKYDDFNVGDALDFWDNGGGDLRISDDINGTTQLPIEVVEFDKVGLSAQVWVKIPSAFTGKTIYLWGDNTGDSQPAVTDAYGRNAVWSDYLAVLHLNDPTYTDSTGNGYDGIANATLPQVSTDAPYGTWTDFTSNTSRKVTIGNSSGILNESHFTVSLWQKSKGNSLIAGLISNRVINSGSEYFQLNTRDDLPNRDYQIGLSDTSGSSTNSNYTSPNYQTKSERLTFSTSPTVISLNVDGNRAINNTAAGDGLMTNSDPITIGNYYNYSYGFNGFIGGVRIKLGQVDDSRDLVEYDNQSTSGAWGTPTRVGGGGATYTINIDSLVAAGSFTDLSLLHNKKLNLDAISATANFDNVDLHYNRKLQLNALASTGQFETVALRHNRKLNLDTLTASGQFEAVTLDYNQGYSLTLGTLAATGGFDDVSLRHNRKLNLGTLSATGQFNDVTLNYTPSSITYTLALETLTATASFDDVALRHNRKLNVEPIVATAYFDDVALLKGHKLNLNSLSSTATFNDVELLHNRVLSLEPVTANANFQAIALNWSGFVEQRITNFSMRYKDNPVKASYKAQPFTIKFKD